MGTNNNQQQKQHQKQQQQQQPHQVDGNGDYNEVVEHIINTSESHAIAMEKDNQYYEMVQKEERAENERLREELTNLEAINAMARTKQIRKEEQKQDQTQRALK